MLKAIKKYLLRKKWLAAIKRIEVKAKYNEFTKTLYTSYVNALNSIHGQKLYEAFLTGKTTGEFDNACVFCNEIIEIEGCIFFLLFFRTPYYDICKDNTHIAYNFALESLPEDLKQDCFEKWYNIKVAQFEVMDEDHRPYGILLVPCTHAGAVNFEFMSNSVNTTLGFCPQQSYVKDQAGRIVKCHMLINNNYFLETAILTAKRENTQYHLFVPDLYNVQWKKIAKTK